jgi:hypothetical protein
MIEARRRAYLEALGFDVWLTRPAAAERCRLAVSGGRGSTLLVCPAPADSETELARDVARMLGGDPVWAWLEASADAAGQPLEEIIAGRLITRVVLFGPEPGRGLFRGPAPEIIGTAMILTAPPLEELAVSGSARRALWRQLRALRTVIQTGSAG